MAAYTEQGPTGLQPYDGAVEGGSADLEPMDAEQFASAVKAALDDAVDYIDGHVASDRELATRYYRGDPFGNEEHGRSQIVMTEVRDTVLAMLPSLLRIFCSSEQAVSFEPRTAQDVELAEQATDYVNYIFHNDCDGFSVLYNAMKDALVRKSGVLKWRWDEDIDIAEFSFTELSDGQLQVLMREPDVEILEQEDYPLPSWQPPPPPVMANLPMPMPGPAGPVPGGPPQGAAGASPMAPAVPPPGAGPMPPGMPGMPAPGAGPIPPGAPGMPPGMPMPPMPPPAPPTMHDVRIRRKTRKNRVKVECVPVEELLVSRNGRDLDTSPIVAHRSLKTFSDLAKMGYSPEELAELSGQSDTFMTNMEAQARNPAINTLMQRLETNDESSKVVVYVEAYIHIDKDGDGIAELRKVCLVGDTVLHDEIVDSVPFAILCPDPEPHSIIGNSVADQTMDLQRLKSAIVRNVMDSLAQSIHPRTAVIEGQVNLDDVMSVETGSIIRMRAAGAVQPFSEPFVGQSAMPIIAWLDEVKAKRTGIVPAAAGLDPDVLQSTTKSGVDATVQGAQERTEMTARIFAEGGIKRMMKGILKLVCRHQDHPRMVRLRGKWTECDPRSWDADMDVIVHVALGRGTDAQRIAALALIATKQEATIQLAGITNPLADLGNLRTTYAKITELAGFKNADEFFKPVNMQAIAQQQAQQPPKPDPNMIVAEAQQAKVQAQIQLDQMKTQLDQARLQMEGQKLQAEAQAAIHKQQAETDLERQRLQMEDARERDKAQLDAQTRLQIAEMQFGLQAQTAERDLVLRERELLQDVVKHRASLDRQDADYERDREVDVAKHQLTVAQKAEAARLAAQARNSQTRPDV